MANKFVFGDMKQLRAVAKLDKPEGEWVTEISATALLNLMRCWEKHGRGRPWKKKKTRA